MGARYKLTHAAIVQQAGRRIFYIQPLQVCERQNFYMNGTPGLLHKTKIKKWCIALTVNCAGHNKSAP